MRTWQTAAQGFRSVHVVFLRGWQPLVKLFSPGSKTFISFLNTLAAHIRNIRNPPKCIFYKLFSCQCPFKSELLKTLIVLKCHEVFDPRFFGTLTIRPRMIRPRTMRPRMKCPLDEQSPGRTVPWTIRPLDDPSPGRTVPWMNHPLDEPSP
jgi:hypothetical protein